MRTLAQLLILPSLLTLLLWGCESSSDPDGDATRNPRDTSESATYRLTIFNDWSRETHPANFPEGAHFSWLGGATHNASVSFWKPGGLATPGIQQMAETGIVEILAQDEVPHAIADGTAYSAIFEKIYTPEQPATAPGSRTTTIEVHRSHPLVTLVTMLGPSPDWFVGVSGLSMMGEGKWRDEISVDLPLYDGGTKEGTIPVMGGPNLASPEPISLITYDAAAGTYVPTQTPHIVGKFVFKRID